MKLCYDGYKEVWSDHFDGDTLNREDWNVELHEPGWVNKEWQEYIDSEEVIKVKDGHLYIYPVKKSENGEDKYYSGRVSTQNKKDFIYGIFEARLKVPRGKGYLPAFWLMSTDENIYGQWPRCGEIDIMEIQGHDVQTQYGTIHYGNPHKECQGIYKLTDDENFSDDFHTIAVEWLPNEIRWYVDGNLFHTVTEWYSHTEGVGTLPYPKPFDNKFYIILNLATGNNWAGYPDETTSFDDNPFIVDYVKVWQRP